MVAAAINPLLTADEIVRLKKEGVADLSDVIVFATGQHHEGDHEFTEADLDTIIANFDALSGGDDPLLNVSVGVGHRNTANPSVGRVTKLWKTPDGLLHATFSDIPRRFAEALDFDVFRYPSIVIDDNPPQGCPGKGFTLRSIDVVDQPAVKRLLKMPKPEYRGQFSERRRGWRIVKHRVTKTPSGYRTFSEVVMDRKALEEQLKSLGWSDTAIAALANLPDEDFAILVNTILADAAGATSGGGTSAAEGDPPTREKMIADLVAAGEDAATLEAMSDADLLALWTQKVGGSSMNSEGAAVKTMTANAGDKPLTQAQFAELKSGFEALQKAQETLKANQRREFAESARRAQSERLASVKSYCERWARDAYVLPAEVDPKCKTPNLYHRLMNADCVRTRMFGEKQYTEFDAIVAEIEARGAGYVRRFFSEKLQSDPEKKSRYDAVREAAAKRHEARAASTRDTPSSRLGLLAPAAHR